MRQVRQHDDASCLRSAQDIEPRAAVSVNSSHLPNALDDCMPAVEYFHIKEKK